MSRAKLGSLGARIGFWSIFYYSYSKEPPKIISVIIEAPILLPETLGLEAYPAQGGSLERPKTP